LIITIDTYFLIKPRKAKVCSLAKLLTCEGCKPKLILKLRDLKIKSFKGQVLYGNTIVEKSENFKNKLK
jgi:hypothetical protein